MHAAGWARTWLIALLVTFAGGAAGQVYPNKPIRLVEPFSPGGGMDVLARSFSPGLTAALGQSLVIDNRPSAGSVVGADLVAKSPPDGYTLLVTGSSNVVGSLLYKKLPYHQDS